MSWELLPVDYTDAVWDGMKKYEPIDNNDGTISLKDVTVYSNLERSFFGAKQANRMNEALNTIMSMVENGTDLYEAFQNYFAEQKELFKAVSNTALEQYNSDLSDLRSNATTTSVEFNTYVEGLKDAGDQAIESIKTNYEAEITSYERDQEKIFDIWFQAMRDKLSQDAAGNLQTEIDDINNNRIQFSVSCPDVLLGETITATNGVDTKTATVDESLIVTFGFSEPGVYTLTDSYTGTEIMVNAYMYGLYPVTVRMGVIKISCPDTMIGKTISCSNGEKTYTRVVNSTKQVVFGVPELGIWEITNNYTEEVIDVDVADYATYEATLHIAKLTVTCDAAYAGETVKVINGSLAYSKEVPDTGIVTFDIPIFGTWTVTNTKTTDSVNINVNAYAEYTAQFGMVGIKVVCGNSQFIGETVTVTKGSTSYTKTVTESLEVTFELNGLGTWTVTNSKTSASIQTECSQYQTYNVEINLVTITVTFTDAAFVGQTVTCTGKSAETKVIGDSLSVSFSVDTGTYTLSNSLTSTTKTVNATEYTTYSASFSLATIVVTCETDDFAGKTITCTDGSTTLSKVVGADLQVSFSVGLGSWTLYNPVKDANENAISVTEYKTYNFTMKKLQIVTWANGSLEDIAKMLEAHYAGTIDVADYWAVGDTRSVDLSEMGASGITNSRSVAETHSAQTVELVILDFNHDTLTTPINGHTKAAITVQQKNCLKLETNPNCQYENSQYDAGMGSMNNYSGKHSNAGGWKSSARRTWCNGQYKNALPSALQNIIKQVSIYTDNTGGGSDTASYVTATDDYVFLPAEFEIFGSRTYANSVEQNYQSQYEYFKTTSNRCKDPKWSSSNASGNWWERSPRSGFSSHFCRVGDSGAANGGTAGGTFGLAPAFCL